MEIIVTHYGHGGHAKSKKLCVAICKLFMHIG